MQERFEIDLCKCKRLSGCEASLFQIPQSVIFDTSLGDRRITALSYLMINRPMTGRTMFSIGDMVEWTGMKQNCHKGKINSKFYDAVVVLEEHGYISIENLSAANMLSSVLVNMDLIKKKCDCERYATIYLDELYKIMAYRNEDKNDRYMSNEYVLMVFACLRSLIYQRRNKLFENEFDVEERRARSPDAYDCYYKDIARDLGISERAVSKSVAALNEMGLIYSETLPRKKSGDKWNTDVTIFCNAYKREKGYLLESGESYYKREIENKKKKLGIL